MRLGPPRRPVRSALVCGAMLAAVARIVAAAPADADPPAASWAGKPPAEWPQLVLTNEAAFDGHTPLQGASAFLVRLPDGRVAVGTAKHLIKEPGGVKPPLPLTDLDRVLTRWRVFPRARDAEAIDAKGLLETTNHEAAFDWLLLGLADPTAKLPAEPLTPRPRPAEVGETVYLVGVPYSDTASAQNVYAGTVIARPRRNYFVYRFTPPVKINGFSGAPVVDAHGLLLGHGVAMGDTGVPKQDGLDVAFGAEDASLLLKLWQHRADGPATRPADAVHLDLPDDWTARPSPRADVLVLAVNAPLHASIELGAVAKADYVDLPDLAAYARRAKENAPKVQNETGRTETDLAPGRAGDRPTMEYQAGGSIRGVPFRDRVVMLECNGCWCRFICWSKPDAFDAAQPAFDRVIAGLK